MAEIQNFKKSFWSFDIEISDLIVICYLGFGVFSRKAREYGAVSSAEEYLFCIQGVVGSNPTRSTLRLARLAQCKPLLLFILLSESKYPELVEGP